MGTSPQNVDTARFSAETRALLERCTSAREAHVLARERMRACVAVARLGLQEAERNLTAIKERVDAMVKLTSSRSAGAHSGEWL